MIHLITGLPGNAKTLFMLQLVIDIASKENRPVYYSGIKEFNNKDERLKGTSWTEFDPKTWHDSVPSGAIIVVDEVQTIFRARAITSSPPPYVTELEQHRHKGLDFYVTTQHPRLIDPALKVLVQSHRHMIRIFGAEMSTVHFWDGIKEKPESTGAKGGSQKTTWTFAKDLYGLYKSADVHTMKRKIPLRVKLLFLMPFVLAGCIFGAYKAIRSVSSDPTKVAASVAGPTPAGQPWGNNTNMNTNTSASPPPASRVDPVQDLQHYVYNETPRVVGLQETKPKYDALTVPVRVPVPSCIQIGDGLHGKTPRCKCYSQQGTPMPEVEYNMCIDLANNGRFLDFDPEKGGQQVAKSEASQRVLADRPDAPLPSHTASGPAVAIIPDLPDRELRQVRVTGQSSLSR